MHITLLGIFVGACAGGAVWFLGRWLLTVFAFGDPWNKVGTVALAIAAVVLLVGFSIGRIAVPTFGLM